MVGVIPLCHNVIFVFCFVYFFICSLLTILPTTKLVLTIAVISKGQQQASVHQQQFNNLLAKSHKQNQPIQIQQQQVRENDPIGLSVSEQITFPSNDGDSANDRQPPATNPNYNLLLQNVEQRISTQGPDNYIHRTTKVATSNNNANQYNDDQYEYIREFSWKLFQVSSVFYTFKFHILFISLFLDFIKN